MKRLFSVPLFLLLTAACAVMPPQGSDGTVAVAREVMLTLPRPGDLARDIEAVQMVSAERNGDTHVFEARLSLKGDRLLMVGTDQMGRRAMTVTWQGRQVTAERADWLPETLKPENILADLVLLFWPKAVVEAAVSGATVRPEASGRAVGDAIRVGWEQPDPWNGRVWLVNKDWGYRLDIRSVTVGP